MKLAIVGSRNFQNSKQVQDKIRSVCNQKGVTEIVSGGAVGVDTFAEIVAEELGIPIKIFLPDWNKFGRAAGPMRNELIVKHADEVLAFWDGKSPGTKSSLMLAHKHHKECETVFPNGDTLKEKRND